MKIPVLLYHHVNWIDKDPTINVNPEVFEEQMRFLSENGYRTLFLNEMMDLRNSNSSPEKVVAITFDDGYLDNWVYAYPILKKYGLKATIFVTTGNIKDASKVRGNTDDILQRKITNNILPKIDNHFNVNFDCSPAGDNSKYGFMNWAELRTMQESGVIDIQSHSHSHGYYYFSDKVIDFNRLQHWAVGWPTDGDVRLGVPIYERKPSLIARRYFDDSKLRDALVNFSNQLFNRLLLKFNPKAWQKRLYKRYKDYIYLYSIHGYHESQADYVKRIKEEVSISKDLIEKRLNKRCDFFSYPAGKYNDTVLQTLKDIGFVGAFTNKYSKQTQEDNSLLVGRNIITNDIKQFQKVLNISTKVAYFLDAFPILSETFILNEIKELKKNGLKVDIISLQKSKEEVVHKDAVTLLDNVKYVSHYRVPFHLKLYSALFIFVSNPARFLNAIFFVIRTRKKLAGFRKVIFWSYFVKKNKFQHIHAHFALDAAEFAMVISLITGIPYSFTAHAYDIFLRPSLLKEKMKYAKYVITVCEYNKNYLLNYYPGFPDDKLKIIFCGVDIREFMKNGRGSKNEIVSQFKIVSVGRLVEKKGFLDLIDALGILNRTGIEFDVEIIGEGRQRNILTERIRDYHLYDKVKLVGELKKEEIINRLASADLFVLPCLVAESGDRDSQPVVLKEAMAMECPVVSTNEVGIPELVEKEAGILVDPGNAAQLAKSIEIIVKMPLAKRQTMGRTGRKIVGEKFNLSSEVEKLVYLFNN